MCGIAGRIVRAGARIDVAQLRQMSRVVQHRGPDGEGHYVRDRVGFAHRRLAIFDVSSSGAQPMTDPQNGCCIVFNGAIYNHPELRNELERAGRAFRSHSDTEVILAAYAEWGLDCVRRFNGMWAFAIHDPVANVVFCSRDRFGVKPFYYIEEAGSFAFGSEPRQLKPLLSKVRVNRDAITDFLLTGACDHHAGSFYADIKKLPPGSSLTFDLTTDRFLLHRYYQIERREGLLSISFDEAMEQYRSTLEDAVQLRLRADVRAGTCLSGGLDSSSVAALASRLIQPEERNRFTAITAVSEDPDNDESTHARTVAEHAGLDWRPVKPDYDHFSAVLPQVADAQDEPFPGPSICMQYIVMAAARSAGVKVLLDGQGGDETLLGYERYFVPYFLDIRRRHGWLRMLSEIRACNRHNTRMTALTIAGYLAWFSSPRLRYRQYRRRSPWLVPAPAMPAHLGSYAGSSQDLFGLQRLEIEATNLPALLRYEDRNSMWHGIETRLPFLDYRLVELALSLPAEFKIADGWTKFLLRRSLQGTLPKQILWRRDKRGFEAPESLWLPRHQETMSTAIGASAILGALCDMKRLRRQFAGLDPGSRWRLYSVALWEERSGVSSERG